MPSMLTIAQGFITQHIPYLYGGKSIAALDCSGMVALAAKMAGLSAPTGGTSEQYAQGSVVPLGPAGNPLLNAQPGDVVFFGMGNASASSQHEGIISSTAGAGTMIDAAHTGTFVREDGILTHGSAEPLSGIRRYTSSNPDGTFSTATTPNSTGPNVASSSPCLISLPLIGCVLQESWGHAIGGAMMLASGAILAGFGLALIIKPSVPLLPGVKVRL